MLRVLAIWDLSAMLGALMAFGAGVLGCGLGFLSLPWSR